MALVNIEELLKEAKKYIKDPDAVIDPYDMSFTWGSEKLMKLHGDDLKDNSIFLYTDDTSAKSDFNDMIMEVSVVNHKLKEKKFIIKDKAGKKRNLLINYVAIEFNDQPYIVVKMLKIGD